MLAPGADEGLPADAGEVERNLSGDVVAAGVLEALDKVEGLEQGLVVRRRAKREQVGQPEEFGPIRAIKAPHQGPVIIMVVGGDLLIALPQRFGAPMRLQQVADAVAQGGFLVFRGVDRLVEDLGKDRQHLLFQLAMLVVQLFEPLFGGVGGAPHALEEHLDQLVARLDLGVMEETEEQALAPGPMQDIAHVAHVEGGGLRGKLLNLGVGNVARGRAAGRRSIPAT